MSRPFGGVFRGRTVLLTGHTGFKGSWLSLWLHDLGARVVGYALPPATRPSLFDELGLERLVESHLGDLRDLSRLSRLMRRTKPEIVFHLAAQPIVRLSYDEPADTFAVNLLGTVHLLEAVRATNSVRVCQIITSDKCYENPPGTGPRRESDRLGGRDPYSASKACAELAVASYRHSFFPAEDLRRHGVSLSSVRAGNVIGGGDWAVDRLLPDAVRALARGRKILVRNPGSVRPWQHVLDPLAGYLHLARRQLGRPAAHAEAWNFGPLSTPNVTAAQIIAQTLRCWGGGAWRKPAQRQGPPESAQLRLDSRKAVRRLGWRPVYGTSRGVQETVRWYRGHYRDRNFDALAFTRGQIRGYMSEAGPWLA
ncbi:MAG: CDP-glucose 4,6-dehydratase [Elusimicrobia bacterium]|nr:CDP-glucose 4,6-dehydratase [Elusimicrobiota bacterium]